MLVLLGWSVINPGVSSGGTSNSTILPQWYQTGPGHDLAGIALRPTSFLRPSRRRAEAQQTLANRGQAVPLDQYDWLEMLCNTQVPAPKEHISGAGPSIFLYMIHRAGRIRRAADFFILQSLLRGQTFAKFDPAHVPAIPSPKPPQYWRLWRKWTMALRGDLATGLWEAKGLAKSTFEASGFSQPSGRICTLLCIFAGLFRARVFGD